MMRRAISLDDASALQEQETVARLRTENATLRRLVETGDVATAGRTAGDGGGAHEGTPPDGGGTITDDLYSTINRNYVRSSI